MADELSRLETREAQRQVQENFPEIEKTIALSSKLLWTAFLRLQEAGFSEAQALQILCARGMNLT